MAKSGITCTVRTKYRMGRDIRHALQGGSKPYDYTLVIGYKGEYPTEKGRRNEPIQVASVAAMLNSGVIGGKTNTSWRTKKRGPGRPRTKKWDYEDKVLNRRVNGKNILNSRISKIMRDVVNGKIKTAYHPLTTVGADLVKKLKAKIWSTMAPKLALKTIENREYRGAPYSEKPLIETQRLVNSIFFKVYKTENMSAIQNNSHEFYQLIDRPRANYTLGERGMSDEGDAGSGLNTEYRGHNPYAGFGTTHYHR